MQVLSTYHLFFLSRQIWHAVTALRLGYPVRGSGRRVVSSPITCVSLIRLISLVEEGTRGTDNELEGVAVEKGSNLMSTWMGIMKLWITV